jgi:hypothetical protein
MALVGRIEIQLTDVPEIRDVLDAALEVLVEVEGHGLIRSYEMSVARLHRALETLSLKNSPLADVAEAHERWLGSKSQ